MTLNQFTHNGLHLPADETLAAELRQAMHRGPHPAYSDVVAARLEQIRKTTDLNHRCERWSCVSRIHGLQSALRRALTERHAQRFWLNRRDPMRIFADRPYLDDAIVALFGSD